MVQTARYNWISRRSKMLFMDVCSRFMITRVQICMHWKRLKYALDTLLILLVFSFININANWLGELDNILRIVNWVSWTKTSVKNIARDLGFATNTNNCFLSSFVLRTKALPRKGGPTCCCNYIFFRPNNTLVTQLTKYSYPVVCFAIKCNRVFLVKFSTLLRLFGILNHTNVSYQIN